MLPTKQPRPTTTSPCPSLRGARRDACDEANPVPPLPARTRHGEEAVEGPRRSHFFRVGGHRNASERASLALGHEPASRAASRLASIRPLVSSGPDDAAGESFPAQDRDGRPGGACRHAGRRRLPSPHRRRLRGRKPLPRLPRPRRRGHGSGRVREPAPRPGRSRRLRESSRPTPPERSRPPPPSRSSPARLRLIPAVSSSARALLRGRGCGFSIRFFP